MEPSAIESKPTGRSGSLTNPEVVEDVPGHIIPILEREFDDFDSEASKFLDGQTPEDQFIGFRLKQGVYGQRQADVQMCRIKLPFGGVNPEQMDAFASVVEKYAPLNKGHITTRQNIQIHHIPLATMAKLIREISATGLSSREGCGNTVRNVTGRPAGRDLRGRGLRPDAVRRRLRPLLRASPDDAADAAQDQDLVRRHRRATARSAASTTSPSIARERDGVRGFEVRVGGGTSIMPRIAPTIWEFASADDGEYMKIAEAVFRIFDRQDWLRVNRARARVKVLVDKIGAEEMTKLVEEELKGDWVDERDFTPQLFLHDEEAGAPAKPAETSSPNGDRTEFDRFVLANVVPQKQEGFSAVTVKVTRGDLTPEQFRGLGQIMRDFTGGYARTTVQQNLTLRWVRNEALYDVWQRLVGLGLGDAGADEITDVVSCPGTDSCKLGITSSMGLNAAVNERINEMAIDDPLAKRIHVKMSGCPNGCSQHHIANIGFYGASIKVGEHTIPAYVAHIGGQYEGGAVAYGTRLKVRLPAKRIPEAVERWIRFYLDERQDDEVFNAFAERVGQTAFEELVKGDLALPVEFGLENMNMFIDWNRSGPFEVIRGEGECAI